MKYWFHYQMRKKNLLVYLISDNTISQIITIIIIKTSNEPITVLTLWHKLFRHFCLLEKKTDQSKFVIRKKSFGRKKTSEIEREERVNICTIK